MKQAQKRTHQKRSYPDAIIQKKNKSLLKNILKAAAVVVIGYFLLTVAFLVDVFYHRMIDILAKLLFNIDIREMDMGTRWYPVSKHVSFFILIYIASYFIFRSRWPRLVKAIYMTVPLAVMYASIGMFLNRWPALVWSLAILCGAIVLLCLYRLKSNWLYYFAFIAMSITMSLVMLFGVDI